MTKKLVFGLILLVIATILVTGCVSCKPACGTIVQKRIIGIVEEVRPPSFIDNYYQVILTDGGHLYFIKDGYISSEILVRDWSEVDYLQPGMQYQWLLEKDTSCSDNRPWTLINTTQI
jgi:hypothetical protein